MDFIIMGPCVSESEPFAVVQNDIPFDTNKVSLCYTGCIHVIGILWDIYKCKIICKWGAKCYQPRTRLRVRWPAVHYVVIFQNKILNDLVAWGLARLSEITTWHCVISDTVCSLHKNLHCPIRFGRSARTHDDNKVCQKKVQNFPTLVLIPIFQN